MVSKRIWLGLGGLYLLLLLGVALFYLLDADLNREDKTVGVVGVAVVPAVAFIAAVAPLWRGLSSRAVLAAASVFASIAASVQLGLTFGLALPLSVVLLGVAAVDAHRAARRE